MGALKARPTEYKGIRYRSKSEAMFARYLELSISASHFLLSWKGPQFSGRTNNSGVGCFEYEPRYLKIGGWVPDFLSMQSFLGGSCGPHITFEIIEYKPSMPTSSYLEECALRMIRAEQALIDRLGFNGADIELNIYYGSPFGKRDVGVFTVDDGAVCKVDYNWLANFEEAILETRFDLEQD